MGSNPIGCPCKKGKLGHRGKAQREGDVKVHWEKMAIYRPRRETGVDPSLPALRRNQISFWKSDNLISDL